MGIINIKDVPDSLLLVIKERFEKDKRVRDLRIQQNLYLRRGLLQKSLEVAEEIDALYADVIRIYLEDADSQQVQFDTETMDIPREDKDRMLELLMVLFMCCDIIESSIQDVNDVLHRTKKDLTINTFDDINQALTMAKEKLKYLSKNSDYMKDLTWGNQCDNMYELMQNKSKSIIRKRKANEADWGKNTERLMKK